MNIARVNGSLKTAACTVVFSPLEDLLTKAKIRRSTAGKMMIASFLFTSKERRVVDTLRLKFFLINVVFYVCWLPNLINGFLLWTMWFNMPVKVIIVIWYIMALMNPMQALLNALVYRKWNSGKKNNTMFEKDAQKEFNFYDEQSPLLGSEPPRLQLSPIVPPSINNYATL